MPTNDRDRRLDRLEGRRPRPRCPQCGNAPFRVVYIDGATDEVLQDNHPSGECTRCGRPVIKEIHIVSDPDEDEAERLGY